MNGTEMYVKYFMEQSKQTSPIKEPLNYNTSTPPALQAVVNRVQSQIQDTVNTNACRPTRQKSKRRRQSNTSKSAWKLLTRYKKND